MEGLKQAQVYEESHEFVSICVVIALLLLRFNRELTPIWKGYSFTQELKQRDHLLRYGIGKCFKFAMSLDPMGVELEERSTDLRFITVDQIKAFDQQKLQQLLELLAQFWRFQLLCVIRVK